MKTNRAALKKAFDAGTEKGGGKAAGKSKIAFSLYRKRGYALGNRLQVWLKAGGTNMGR